MPSYRYEGITSTGEAADGTVQASSEASALEKLRAAGLFVQRCERLTATEDAEGQRSGNPDPAGVLHDRTSAPSRKPPPEPPRRTWSHRQAAILLSFFTLGGLVFALLGAWNTWLMARQLDRAQSTVGIVRSAEVRIERSTDSEGDRTTHYVPSIRYTYEVDGVQFESVRLYPGRMLIRSPAEQSRGRADRFVRHHVPGTEVTVWYVPDEPELAFLKRVRRVTNGLFAVVGGILAAVGAGLLLPQIVRDRLARFWYAIAVFFLSQGLTWLLWEAFLRAPREELDSSPRLLQWLLAAYLVVCWVAVIGNSPPPLKPSREATLAGVGCGTISMSLSLFVLVPLTWFAPKLQPLSALPWIGVGMCLLGLVLWMCGCVTIGHHPAAATGADHEGEKSP